MDSGHAASAFATTMHPMSDELDLLSKTLSEDGLKVAKELGLTITATQRASKLHRQMQALGLTDPYVEVTEPPSDLKKMRRHLHPRYKFDPLPPDEAS